MAAKLETYSLDRKGAETDILGHHIIVLNILKYADVIIVMGSNKVEIELVMEHIERSARDVGLEITEKQTVYMTVNKRGDGNNGAESMNGVGYRELNQMF